MATNTAQVLIGRGHPNDGGINPSHSLYLSENSRPSLTIVPNRLNGFRHPANARDSLLRQVRRPPVWIPTVENTIDDIILMISLFIVQDQRIVDEFEDLIAKEKIVRLTLYDSFSEEERVKLYQVSREISSFPKLIFSIFSGSHLKNQINHLEQYSFDVEVLITSYSREYSEWTNSIHKHGSLYESTDLCDHSRTNSLIELED